MPTVVTGASSKRMHQKPSVATGTSLGEMYQKPRLATGASPEKMLQKPKLANGAYPSSQRSYKLVDTVLNRIVDEVLGDGGSIEECLASALVMSIPDVVSQSLGDLDALFLSASERYLLKAFKGYVWWHHIYQGGSPCFASRTKEKFDSFLCSHHWNPK